MSGNATLTTNRSRLAMNTAAETTARTEAVRGDVFVMVSSFSEPTLILSMRATAHIRRTGLLDRSVAGGRRRPLDAADHSRRLPGAAALPGVRGRPRRPEEGPE